jgi:hypothetical protein
MSDYMEMREAVENLIHSTTGKLDMNGPKIEKQIPAPRFRSGWAKLLSEMEIGDSILVTDQVRECMHIYAKRAGVKVKTRKENDGARVWRIE